MPNVIQVVSAVILLLDNQNTHRCPAFKGRRPGRMGQSSSRNFLDRASSGQPCPVNFGKDIVQRLGDVPVGIMRLHFGQIADVTDVIALAISVNVLPDHLLAGHLFSESERLKDGTTVATTSTEAVNLTAT